MTPLCLQEEEIVVRMCQDLKFYLVKEWKASKREIRYISVRWKITEKLDSLEISNFLKRSAEAAVRKCTSLSSQGNTRDGVLFQ